MVAEEVITERVPIKTDHDGTVRVSGTRVTLETVVGAFLDGETPEGIVDSYPSLPLADVYRVIAYYLSHSDEVTAYIQKQEKAGEGLRELIEKRCPPDGILERLLARQRSR